MCLVSLAWQAHPRFPMVLASNRDEFHARPASPMRWWDDADILAGRDEEAGGTWLGLNRRGRLALVTNVREPQVDGGEAASRGQIVPAWLDPERPAAFVHANLKSRVFRGFNALFVDLQEPSAWWHSNRVDGLHGLASGVSGLSNGALDTPWPKVLRLKRAMSAALVESETAADLTARLMSALQDRLSPADHELPDTGVGLALERMLGPVFIQSPDGRYGTRCSTVVVAERSAEGLLVHVTEQSWDAAGRAAGTVRHTLRDGAVQPARTHESVRRIV